MTGETRASGERLITAARKCYDSESTNARVREVELDECDLAGMTPADNFEQWLNLFPGPDSAADAFFEAVAIEFQLRRDCPWPERFGSFDALVSFVTQHAPAAKAC